MTTQTATQSAHPFDRPRTNLMFDAPPGLIEAYINDENPLAKAEWAKQGGEWNEIIPKVVTRTHAD